MERKIFDDHSFENALQQRVEGYRMYPSDKRWNTLYKQLHPSRGQSYFIIHTLLTLLFISSSIPTSRLQQQAALLPQQEMFSKNNAREPLAKPLLQKNEKNTSLIRTTPANNEAYVITNASTALHAYPLENSGDPLVPSLAQITHTRKSAAVLHPTIAVRHAASIPVFIPIEPASDEEAPAERDATNSLTDKELNYEVSLPTATRIKKPVQLLLYGAPSMSYRVLIADNKITWGNVNPETQVSHTAAIGWEAGVAALLPMSDRLRISLGAQVNYTRYTVSASQAGPEISNVVLTTSTRMQRISTLRNTNTGLPRQLANETLQFSIPVGMEYRMAGSNRLSWNLAGTLQPTYLLGATGYMVSTDYRNYFKAPDLLRRLNINTSLETFVRFQAGKFDLQAGPQLRYQLLSNSTGIYPIREHLVDYGFKLGLIRTIR